MIHNSLSLSLSEEVVNDYTVQNTNTIYYTSSGTTAPTLTLKHDLRDKQFVLFYGWKGVGRTDTIGILPNYYINSIVRTKRNSGTFSVTITQFAPISYTYASTFVNDYALESKVVMNDNALTITENSITINENSSLDAKSFFFGSYYYVILD